MYFMYSSLKGRHFIIYVYHNISTLLINILMKNQFDIVSLDFNVVNTRYVFQFFFKLLSNSVFQTGDRLVNVQHRGSLLQQFFAIFYLKKGVLLHFFDGQSELGHLFVDSLFEVFVSEVEGIRTVVHHFLFTHIRFDLGLEFVLFDLEEVFV